MRNTKQLEVFPRRFPRPATVRHVAAVLAITFLSLAGAFAAQTGTTSATVQGTVTDPTGAVVPGATVEILNPVNGYHSQATTDADGHYRIVNIPFAPYHMTISATGFASTTGDVDLRSAVTMVKDFALQVAQQTQSVTVEAESQDLIEQDPSAHTDINQTLIAKLPTESTNSSLSSVITLASPGVAADSNGLFHPLGEHAETSFSVDGQPITDQQSRIFANQLPVQAVQSLEVISGIPPAEYGDKASLVAVTTTKSGLGTKMFGAVSAGYGSFGTSTGSISLGGGNSKFGNFINLQGVNSGRYLDTPEFQPLHARGNSESLFDRFDYQLRTADSFHVNLGVTRAWFQVPNQYDQQLAGQDQRQENKGANASLFWTHVISPQALFSTNIYARQDRVGYYPSADAFADLPATLQQQRRLSNLGIKSDYSYVKGHHNIKAGATFQHTLLSEEFSTGITDPAYNAVCLDANGSPIADPTVLNPACTGAGQQVNPNFQAGLLPYDLTRGGAPFLFRGHGDIREEALYGEDTITLGSWQFMTGLRFDNYDGLSSDHALQPRLAATYNVKKTGTVFRAGYARVFVTPYNENLVLSSSTGIGGLAAGAFGIRPLRPGNRNQFDVGFEQAFGKYLVVDGEYFWKFTGPDFDFDTVLNTPLTFPIEWQKSKIDGAAVRVNMPTRHGFTAYAVLGHSRSRFFGPEVGGILFNDPALTTASAPFRIDHDQAFQQTTHLQWQPKKEGGWLGFTWRYDSGLVAGAIPDIATALSLTGDQQQQIGLSCNGVPATVFAPISSCPSGLTVARVRIPAPGTENDDTNPPRIAPRHLFDVGAGWDNIFRADRFKTDATLTVVNLTNQEALYNFLSTFSGTHFVSPRTYTAELTLNF